MDGEKEVKKVLTTGVKVSCPGENKYGEIVYVAIPKGAKKLTHIFITLIEPTVFSQYLTSMSVHIEITIGEYTSTELFYLGGNHSQFKTTDAFPSYSHLNGIPGIKVQLMSAKKFKFLLEFQFEAEEEDDDNVPTKIAKEMLLGLVEVVKEHNTYLEDVLEKMSALNVKIDTIQDFTDHIGKQWLEAVTSVTALFKAPPSDIMELVKNAPPIQHFFKPIGAGLPPLKEIELNPEKLAEMLKSWKKESGFLYYMIEDSKPMYKLEKGVLMHFKQSWSGDPVLKLVKFALAPGLVKEPEIHAYFFNVESGTDFIPLSELLNKFKKGEKP